MVKVILLAILCVLTFVSCETNAKNKDDTDADKTYTWTSDDGEYTHSAAVTLYDNGTFQFVFSPLSSYIGVGEYSKQDDKLILETEDGEYTYTFDMSENSLIFDSENSSDNTWYSEFEDGAVFVKS